MRTTVAVLLMVVIEVGVVAAPAQDGSKQSLLIHTFENGLAGVRARNPDVHLTIGRDPSGPDESVIFVEYPAPTTDPAGRDVRCDAQSQDWSSGRAISFQVKPSHDMRLSISFFDRNGVVYTAWANLKADAWQPVEVAFDEVRPNPYFQPPGAKLGSAIDVSDVSFIAFAPQDQTSGRLAVGKITVVK
jgi:hypothetical protein